MLHSQGLDYTMSASRNQEQGWVDTATNLVAATGLDILNTMARSITFGAYEETTADWLEDMGADQVMATYNRHRASIETASLIGGAIIPGIAAIKAVNYARNGMKGANWFSTAGRTADVAKAKELYKQGKPAHAAYLDARKQVYMNAIKNGMVDNIAAEFAILATQNAHPMMEDYLSDPLTGIGMSLALGGVLSVGIDTAFARGVLTRTIGGEAAKINKSIQDQISVGLQQENTAVTNYVVNVGTIGRLDSLIAAPGSSPFAREQAAQQIEKIKADNALLLQDAVSKDLLKHEDLVQEILDNPMTVGAEKMSFFDPTDTGSLLNKFKGFLKAGVLTDEGTARVTAKGKPIAVLYDPKSSQYVGIDDGSRITGAADFGATKGLESAGWEAAKHTGSPQLGYVEDMAGSAAGKQEQDFLGKVLAYDKMKTSALSDVVLAEDDYGSILALTKVMSERKAALISLTDAGGDGAQAAFKELQQLNSAEVLIHEGGNLARTLSKRYQKEHSIPTNQMPMLHTMTKQIESGKLGVKVLSKEADTSAELKKALHGWIGDGTTWVSPTTRREVASGTEGAVRMKSIDYFRFWVDKAQRSRQTVPEWATEFVTSEHRKKLHQQLKNSGVVGVDDKLFMYRGQKRNPNGHHAVESFTSSRSVAQAFAGPDGVVEAYQVDLKDVLAYVSGQNEAEFLIASPTRTTLTSLTQKVIKTDEDGMLTVSGVKKHSLESLTEDLGARMTAVARSLNGEGVPIEEIATRTGMSQDSVKGALGATNSQHAPIQYSIDTMGESLVEAAKNMAKDDQRLVRLVPSKALPTYAKYTSLLKSNADQKVLDDFSSQLVTHEMEVSSSRIMRDLVDQHPADELAVVVESIGNVTQELASGRFMKSADFYLRKMGDLQKVVTNMANRLTSHRNDVVKREMSPLFDAASEISKDKADIVLTNTAYEVYKGIDASKGKIRFNKQGGTFEQLIKSKDLEGKPVENWVVAQWDGKDFSIPASAGGVRDFFEGMGVVARTVQESRATRTKIIGGTIHDIGYYLPNFSPDNKIVNFVKERVNGDIVHKVVWGKTELELSKKIGLLHQDAARRNATIEIISNRESNYKKMQAGMHMEVMAQADVSKLKQGRTQNTFISDNSEIMSEILGGFTHSLQAEVSRGASMIQHKIHSHLDNITEMERVLVEDQALTRGAKERIQPPSPAQIVKSMMQGLPATGEYQSWSAVNNAAEWVASGALNLINKTLAPAIATKRFILGKSGTQDFANLSKELEAKGYINPWKIYEQQAPEAFALGRELHPTDSAKRAIAAANGLAATFALRFMELGQPLVNMMSLPIMSMSALSHTYDDVFMGQKMSQNKVHPMAVMMDGVRMLNDDSYKLLTGNGLKNADGTKKKGLWEEGGYVDPIVSEATKVMRMAHIQEPGFIATIERFLDSKAVDFLSKPSDFSEKMSRQVSMATGTQLGVKLYGFDLATEAGRRASIIFANDFTARAIGNYASAQRPVMFQGTAGAALGLFQTYVLTFAQNMYRHVEVKDYKALGKVAALQAGVFGVNSWPGFNMMSDYIGEHFSDEHKDLRTGTYTAIPNQSVANGVLYGLPATMGALWGNSNGLGMSSRGELGLRIPLVGDNDIAAAGMISDIAQGSFRVLKAGIDRPENALASMAEALTLQSVSRPIARMTELLTGRSLNQSEGVVSTSDDVHTPAGIIARIFAMRSTDEVRQRQAIHLNSMYGMIDAGNRNKAVKRMRTAIREGNLSDGLLAEVSEDYLKTGSPQGFRSAMQHAIGNTEQGAEYEALRSMSPDSPLWLMLNDI